MYGSIFNIYYFQLFCTSNVDFMGPSFGVDFSKEAVAGSGLAMVNNILKL